MEATRAEKVRLLAGLVATEGHQLSNTKLDYLLDIAQGTNGSTRRASTPSKATQPGKIGVLAGHVATSGYYLDDSDLDLILEVLGFDVLPEQPVGPTTTSIQTIQNMSSKAQGNGAPRYAMETQVAQNGSRSVLQRPAEDPYCDRLPFDVPNQRHVTDTVCPHTCHEYSVKTNACRLAQWLEPKSFTNAPATTIAREIAYASNPVEPVVSGVDVFWAPDSVLQETPANAASISLTWCSVLARK
jgi:hypothetical protein